MPTRDKLLVAACLLLFVLGVAWSLDRADCPERTEAQVRAAWRAAWTELEEARDSGAPMSWGALRRSARGYQLAEELRRIGEGAFPTVLVAEPRSTRAQVWLETLLRVFVEAEQAGLSGDEVLLLEWLDPENLELSASAGAEHLTLWLNVRCRDEEPVEVRVMPPR